MVCGSTIEFAAVAPLAPVIQNTVAPGFDWGAFVGPAVVAAAVSGIVATIGFLINRSTSLTMHTQKLAADEKLAERKFEFDKAITERKFLLDARTADRKRKQDLAEAVLTGFYQVEAIMRSVRSPMSYAHEAENRPKIGLETDATARLRDTYFVILARYDKNRQEVSHLLALRYRMSAWFGVQADAPFQRLQEGINKVITAAQLLGQWSADADGFRANNLALWQQMEADIWWGTEDPDRVAAMVAEAVSAMETICRPILAEVISA